MSNFTTAAHALAPIVVAGIVIFGLACLLLNGAVLFWIVFDQVMLRLPSRKTPAACSLDDLMDGDTWAEANDYGPGRLDEQTEDWIFESPLFQIANPDRTEAVLFAASVLADIDEWTDDGGVA